MLHRVLDKLSRYAIAVAALASAAVATALAPPFRETPSLFFFFAILISAWFGGRGPAVLAIAVSIPAVEYFCLPLGQTYSINVASVLRAAGLIAVSLPIIWFAEKRRKSEAALRQQAARLKEQAHALNLAHVLVCDMDGRIKSWSDAAVRIYGWKKDEAEGRRSHELLATEFPTSLDEIQSELTRRGQWEGELTRTRRDGAKIVVATHWVLHRDYQSNELCVLEINNDVTRQKQLEESFRVSEQRFARFMRHLPGLAWIKDLEGRYVYANAAAEKAFGKQRSELYGKTDDDLFPPETAAVFRKNDHRAVECETGIQTIETLQEPDGVVHHSVVSKFPIVGADGRISLVGGMAIDITQRIRAEEDQARLAAIVESTSDAIISKSLDGIIQTWNSGAERLFGYSAAEAVGKSILLIIPPERHEEEESILRRLRAGERIEHFETVRVAKDGRRLDISITVSPVRDASGRVIGASKIARDVSERKRIEESLRDADRRKDEFLATLAHELRNPLAPIRSGLHALRLAGRSGRDTTELQEILERQMQHLVRLIDDLLDISRISKGKIHLRKERVELATIVHDAVEASRPNIDVAEHKLTVSLPSEKIFVVADPTRLSQVVSNLLNNAAKFTERRGRISVTCVVEKGDDAALVAIRVKDSGIGIPPHMLPRVFEKFMQLDQSKERSRGGLGIGLNLVFSLVEMHGGTVEAHSDGPGRGSEFVVRLPMVEAVAPSGEPAGMLSAAPPEACPPRRILVVDDKKDVADSLAMMLGMLGHTVSTANDGPSALATAESFRPEVALLDIGMPGMSGYDVAQRIRRHPSLQDVVLVAVTGWGDDSDRLRSQEAGFDHHLVKPVRAVDLEHVLARLERSQRESPLELSP